MYSKSKQSCPLLLSEVCPCVSARIFLKHTILLILINLEHLLMASSKTVERETENIRKSRRKENTHRDRARAMSISFSSASGQKTGGYLKINNERE